jgi:hypothetical protein
MRSLAKLVPLLTAAAIVLALVAASASALPKVTKRFPTRVFFSASKGADGAVTVKASFRSPEPRCLSAKRFLQKKYHGLPDAAGAYLLFGGQFSGEHGSGTFGFEGEGAPPSSGLLSPVSPPEGSPYVWEATWPGDTPVTVTNFYDPSHSRHYETTVAAASGVRAGALARASAGQGLSYYKTTYNKGGKHYIVKCGVLKKTEERQELPL